MIKSYIVETERFKKLGKHFIVNEFACKDESPVVFIDEDLWKTLDTLREKIGKPIIITSGYRTPGWNKKSKVQQNTAITCAAWRLT